MASLSSASSTSVDNNPLTVSSSRQYFGDGNIYVASMFYQISRETSAMKLMVVLHQ